jgi:cytochrome P450
MGSWVRQSRSEVPLGRTPILGNSDPPDHTRLRAIVNRAFTPRAIAAMRPVVESAIEELLESAGGDTLDVMRELAEPLVVTIVLEHLGVPADDRIRIREWATAIIRARSEGASDPVVVHGAAAAREQLLAYLSDLDRHSRTTIIDTLRDAVGNGAASADEMMMQLVHISMAGNGPTAYAMGNTVMALAGNPGAAARLQADPALIPGAVEETLRWDSPTHLVARFATTDTRLGARTVGAGDTCYAVIGAANRDPARFPRPDEFEPDRTDNRHLSFGMGIHFCLGAPLARLEIECVVRATLDRFGVPVVERMERGGTFLLRGPKSVVIRKS